jgi:hypothetical protein
MSIVIDMEMPENCLECKLADRYHHDECPIYAICKSDYVDKRFEKCPIKAELPAKHGRLIDKDRLKREMLWNFAGEKIPLYDCDNNPVDFHVKDVEATINSQPTVIETEGK